MDTIRVIKSRFSVRKYKDKEIPREILEDIIDCARLAPTGYNSQPWKFVVVTDREIKNKIADAASYGKFIRQAGAAIAVFGKKDAPTLLEDTFAATENIIIAAQAYGLGTCWLNSHMKEHSPIIKQLLNCPHDMELMSLLAVGYPDQQKGTASKKPLSEVLLWDRFPDNDLQ